MKGGITSARKVMVLASLQKTYKAAIEQNRQFAEAFRKAMAKLGKVARERALTEQVVRDAQEATQAVETADVIESTADWSPVELEHLRRRQAQRG